MKREELTSGAVVAEAGADPSSGISEKHDTYRETLTRGVEMKLLILGAVLVAVIGTWLVWLSVYLQRHFAEEEIRLACKRVMPETAERCFDTVILQRGGARR
jgi:hypothetical protein